MQRIKFTPEQQIAVPHLLQTPYAGLFMDPGMGKTLAVIETLDVLREKKLHYRAVIVSTLRAAQFVWGVEPGNEFDKWGYKFTRVVLTGARKLKQWEAIKRNEFEIIVTNYESLPFIAERWREVKDIYRVLVFDESTKVKTPRAQRSKCAAAIAPSAVRHIILTGTPAPQGLIDLFGQAYVMDMGAALGKYISNYRRTYFEPAGMPIYVPSMKRTIPSDWVPQKDAEQRILARLSPSVVHFPDSTNNKLAPPQMLTLEVVLPAKARTIYEREEAQVAVALENGNEVITLSSASTALTRLRQIASGGLYLHDEATGKRETRHIHNEKSEAIAQLVESLQGKPLLVAYEFQHDLDRLLGVLGKTTPRIGTRNDAEVMAAFNAGHIPVLLAQSSSVAHGVNLQAACSHIAWHSLTYNLETYLQFNKRVHRLGQFRQVRIYHVIARETCDVDIFNALMGKHATQASILKEFERATLLRAKTRGYRQ